MQPFAGAASAQELDRPNRRRPPLSLTEHLDNDIDTDPVRVHQPLQVVDAAHRHAVDRHDQVLRAQPRISGG